MFKINTGEALSTDDGNKIEWMGVEVISRALSSEHEALKAMLFSWWKGRLKQQESNYLLETTAGKALIGTNAPSLERHHHQNFIHLKRIKRKA
jgi:hypothetical protein